MMPLPMSGKTTDTQLLARTRVATPCRAEWSQMVGDDKSRYCGSCKKNVYNLSAMTGKEAATLIREKEGNVCIRYYQRADGTVMTQDCPVGVAAVKRKITRAFAAVVVGVTSGLMLAFEGVRIGADKPSLFAERWQVWAQRISPPVTATLAVAPIPLETPAPVETPVPVETPSAIMGAPMMGEMAPEPEIMGKPSYIEPHEVMGRRTTER
ncbi:MAG: hypothetical protein H8F28_24055 [Fibrella sp.]|nr:hypothetical protein [Armatimonadota bacterium]